MKIPGTRIEVDDFRTRDAELHVLTHYHADHRKGLLEGDSRPILCSSLTARLLIQLHGVRRESVATLDPGGECVLRDGTRIRAYDANHCPGALMLRFDTAERRVLHTGDFRYCAAHDQIPDLFDRIDLLMLDATYEDGEHEHPSQEVAIEAILDLVASHPNHRVKLGVYRIGKNKIVEAIRQRLGLKIALSRDYFRIYRILGMEDCVTEERSETRVHGYGMRYFSEVKNAVDATSIAILPTAWTAGRVRGEGIFFVPYSEHCSTTELRRFVGRVGAREIVRTNDPF